MPLSFETQMLRIGELFCDAAVFTMPPFQRPYCWDEATAARLGAGARRDKGNSRRSGRERCNFEDHRRHRSHCRRRGRRAGRYLKQLASFILNNCYVIQVTARDLDAGYVLFRSLNSRGQPLDELDLARAELLGADQPQVDVSALIKDWNEAELNLGRDEFTEYLHSVLSLVANRPQGRDLRDLIKEVLGDSLQARNFRILLASSCV